MNFHTKYSWVPRYIKKRAFQRVRYLKARLSGYSSYEIIIRDIPVIFSFSTPYHHSIAPSIRDGEWSEFQLLSKWFEKAKLASIIFDVGGFNGIYGILAAKANPNATVIIFEPDPTNVKHIRRNILLNKVNCRVVDAAVSDRNGTINFSADGSTGSKITSWGVETPMVRLSDFGSPELLKIDVEGHELAVLRGANITETKTIIIEENATPILEGFTKVMKEGITGLYER